MAQLSTLTSIERNVRRNSNNFSFVDTLASFVGNRDFLAGHTEFDNGKTNENTYIWEALSAIGNDCGDILYSNVLNYIDLVSNIDLCKIKSLQSMVKMIGVNYSIFDTIDVLPLEIHNIMDVLSINKKYLLDTGVLNSNLVNDLSANILEYGDLSSQRCYISDVKYKDYIKNTYLTVLSDMVNMDCGLSTDVKVYDAISSDILNTSDQTDDNDLTSYVFRSFKTLHNIPVTFDEIKIVDEIDVGNDSLDNYSGFYLELLQKEIDRRANPYSYLDPTSKYEYYREQKLKEYINFIENKIYIENETYLSDGYELDKNYLEVENTNKERLLTYENDTIVVNSNMINRVAQILADTTIYISEVREKLKSQTQKNYLKGTFTLLSYVINEYLIEFSKHGKISTVSDLAKVKAGLDNHIIDDIKIIEYDDVTEYYNLSSSTSKLALNGNTVNARFWETANSHNAPAFSSAEIENYYRNTLNLNNDVTDLTKFLRSIYSVGADTNYINNSGEIVDTNGNLGVFLDYHGTPVGYNPAYNHKNKAHSSYQLHPYLYNFIEHMDYVFPVVNAFNNDINDTTETQIVESNLSNYIGEYGQTINLWINNSYDFSGYRTRYEYGSHTSNLNASKKFAVADYDGGFYPPAVKDLLASPNDCITSVRDQISDIDNPTFYDKYYADLALTHNQYDTIATQLSANIDIIRELAEDKTDLSDVYDIYKYGRDIYDNIYILYKKYNGVNLSYKDKENTPGQLWIRLNNHPIAFPAIYGTHPAIDTSDINMNGKFKNLAKGGNLVTDENKMAYFFDMDFSDSKEYLFLADFAKNDTIDNKKHLTDIQSIDVADIVVSKIVYKYDLIKRSSILSLNSDQGASVDAIYNPNKTKFKFVGFQKVHSTTNFFFIKNDPETLIDKTLNFTVLSYIEGVSLTESQNVYLELQTTNKSANVNLSNFSILDSDVKMCSNDSSVTFVFEMDTTQLEYVSNYVGGKVDYVNATTNTLSTESNSFDALNQYIAIVDAKFDTFGSNAIFDITKIALYNLNADASYIPSYAGLSGMNDISLVPLYGETKTHNIQLLGKTSNKLSGCIEDAQRSNSNQLDYTIDINTLKDKVFGRVFEDAEDLIPQMVTIVSNPLMTDKNSYYDTETNSFHWNIEISSMTYNDVFDINDITMVMYKTGVCGRNPYVISRLSCDSIHVNYLNNTEYAEVKSLGLPNMYIAGTYNFYDNKPNLSENNHLNNISTISVEKNATGVDIQFTVNDITKKTFIDDGTVTCIFYNKKNLREYEFYHFLDVNGKVIDHKFNGIDLSSVELSGYDSLSSVPMLSGYDNLDFKFDEEAFFREIDNQWYVPGHNQVFPITTYDVATQLLPQSIFSLSGVFDNNNLFINKITKDDIVNEIGPIEFITSQQTDNTECVRIFEDYYSGNNKLQYNTNDPRFLEYVHFFNNDNVEISDYVLPDDESYISANNISGYVNEYIDLSANAKFFVSQTESDINKYQSDYSYWSYCPSISSDNIAKLLNIYVSYDDDKTLYFNYNNYLCSPFIKKENGKITLDIIDGTYLKLKAGESGTLDIVVQFKYYAADGSLESYKTIKLVGYKVYNVSDDKPKFLVYKDSEIIYGSNSVASNDIVTKTDISAISKRIEAAGVMLDAPVEYTQDININSNKYLNSTKFTVLFNDKLTEYVGLVNDDTYNNISAVQVHNSIVFDINDIKRFEHITLSFKTLNTLREILANNYYYDVFITSPTVYDEYGVKSEVSCYNGNVFVTDIH